MLVFGRHMNLEKVACPKGPILCPRPMVCFSMPSRPRHSPLLPPCLALCSRILCQAPLQAVKRLMNRNLSMAFAAWVDAVKEKHEILERVEAVRGSQMTTITPDMSWQLTWLGCIDALVMP
jgi:hypothetical protein